MNKVKSIVFYATVTPPKATPLGCTTNFGFFMAQFEGSNVAHVTIRTEVVDAEPSVALAKATPAEGEIVLNAEEVPS